MLVGDRARPARLDPTPAADRRTRGLRAQAPALPAAARRRTPRLPRPQSHATHRRQVALGRRARRRVHTRPSVPPWPDPRPARTTTSKPSAPARRVAARTSRHSAGCPRAPSHASLHAVIRASRDHSPTQFTPRAPPRLTSRRLLHDPGYGTEGQGSNPLGRAPKGLQMEVFSVCLTGPGPTSDASSRNSRRSSTSTAERRISSMARLGCSPPERTGAAASRRQTSRAPAAERRPDARTSRASAGFPQVGPSPDGDRIQVVRLSSPGTW